MLFTILFFAALVTGQAAPLEDAQIPTPIARAELREALRAGHVAVFGIEPNAGRLAMAEAQCRHEGPGLNHNVGAIGAVRGQRWFRLGGSRFRAYRSHLEGAIGYWQHLRRRCNSAFAAFDAGLPREAARALDRCRYYRAPERLYAEALEAMFSPE